jgi:hypothetical protein
MSRAQVKAGAVEIKGGIEAAAVKLMGGTKSQAKRKTAKAIGIACQALRAIKSASRKGVKTIAYKAASGLRY